MRVCVCARFSNPVTLLCGEVCCSPYRNKDQTDSRTTSCQFGYPYNWEPLNFVRSATSLVCSSFAAFEILSYRKFFADVEEEEPAVVPGEGEDEDEDEDVGLAMEYWVYSCMGIAAFYVTMCLIRWCATPRHTMPCHAMPCHVMHTCQLARLGSAQLDLHCP